MDGTDEWALIDAADMEEERYMRQRIVEKKNTYCNLINDYNKLRQIAAKIINALDIKEKEADTVKGYDIEGLYVDDSRDMIDIEWTETIDRGSVCQETNSRLETVPAEWFALEGDNLRGTVESYKKQMRELVEGLKRDLKTAEENKKDADERISQIKRQLSRLEGY